MRGRLIVTLSDALHEKDEPLDWGERESVSREIIAGLFYLHSKNIIHGNFKTQNILITEKNHAKISDFGLSIPHQVSIPYRAPELISNAEKIATKETDVYSLGVILWEILTCKIPFNQLDDFGIRSYWNSIADDPRDDNCFEMPMPDPSLPEVVHRTYTLLAPMVKACRQIDPEVRPRMSQLKLK